MDGDSLVAVVRGSKYPGLSVTLLRDAYFTGDIQKFNIHNEFRGFRQCNAQTNTERIPQNNQKYNVTYQFANFYKPSVHCVLPSPYQTAKRTYVKNLRVHTKIKRQRCNRHVDTNQQVDNSAVNRSLSSVDARSSSQKELTKYMYDYLKSESMVPNVDVRYFTEIKKALRNGLRRIADSRTIPCPVRRSRYYRHKRYGNCSKHSLTDSIPYGTKILKHTKSSNISRRKCFCRQPVTCECDTTRKPATRHICTKYFNGSNSKRGSESQLNQNMFDVCAPGDFTESKYQKIFDVIYKWVNDIPKHPNFDENDKSKQDTLIRKLAENFKEIFNTEDFVIRARPEILKCLNDLPMLRPDDATAETRLIEDLINDLIDRFVQLAESEFIECISSEIKKIAFENNTSAGNFQSKINDFASELKPIALKRPTDDETYKEILEEKLVELFKNHRLVSDITDTENINDLADKFADRLCHIYLYNIPNNEGETIYGNVEKEKIFDWLQDTPEFSYNNINECSELIDLLLSKCKNYTPEDIKNRETEKKLHNDIEKCLDSIANKFHISLTTERKKELTKQLKTLLFGLDTNNNDEDDTSLGTVLEWLLTIPGLSEQNIIKNEEEINNYAKLMKQVQTQINNKMPNVKKVISNWLQNFLRKNNIQLDPKVYDNLINKLIHKVNDMSTSAPVVIKQRKRWDDQDTRTKFSDIKHIVDVCCSDFGVNVKEVTKRKICEEILKNITDQNVLSDKILKSLISILTKDTSLGKSTIKKLSNEIVHHVKKLCNPKENMTSQLNKLKSEGSHQEETLLVNLSLNNPSLDRSSKGSKNMQTQEKEKGTKNLHKSEENVKEKNSKHISQNEISQYKSSTNDAFEFTESKAGREMLGPNPVSSIKNTDDRKSSMKEYYRESSSILENIKAVSKNLLNKKIQKLKVLKENDQRHSRNVDTSTQTEPENLSFDDNFTTSTPLDYSQKDVSIDVKGLSTENNKMDQNAVVKEELSDHTKYLNDARSTIHNWLKLFDIDISILDMNNLTEVILYDYLERQNYLQISGIKTTRNDEIEQLKYQIYRQMYKFTNSETLQCVMEKVTDLYENLKNLKHSKMFEEEHISDKDLETLSTEDINELTQKIRLWLNSISSQFHLSSDKKYQENMSQELSKRLNLLKKEGNYEDYGKNTITTWLQKVLNVSDINDLNDLADSLMMYIENDSLRDTQIPIQDISEFIVENLSGAILDWIRETKPFPNNIMTNRPLIENFATVLANGLKRVFENNSNIWSSGFENLLMEEMVRNFKTILHPDKKDPVFLQKLAKSLISYIKQQRLFHDISDRLTMNPIQKNVLRDEWKYSNEMKQAILLWSKNLALETDKSFEDIEDSIRGFIEYLLTYIIEDVNSIENRLKEDTLKLLQIIPLKIHQERNTVLQAYITSLIDTIKSNINSHTTVEDIKEEVKDNLTSQANVKNIDDLVHDIIKNWCDILPLHVDTANSRETIKEIRKNLASHIIRFIAKLNSNDNIPEKNVYKILRDDIKDQLKTLHTSPDLEKCIDLLIDVLIEKLKDAKCLNVKESIGSIYNLLLHETVNKTLSLIDNPSGNDRISFDLLKEKLANAFIELHHPIDDVDIRNKYKDKLCNVIDKFCKDYLDRSLILPRDSEKVKEDLDDALRNVSIPKLMISRETSGNIDQNVESKRHISTQCDINIPPSRLSMEDIELMNNIRARSETQQVNLKTIRRDVSISPMPVNADTQTETQFNKSITDGVTQTSKNSSKERLSVRKETLPQISPQVVIKEYYWDTSGSNQSLRMSILSELSQKIDPSPSVIAQTEDLVKKKLVSTGQQTQMNETGVNSKTIETTHTQTDIPKKHTKNNFQQTSNTFEPVVLSKSHLDVNRNASKHEIEDVDDDDNNVVEVDLNTKRLVIPSGTIPPRHTIHLEGDRDVHIKKNKARKDIISDVSKMISGNREIETYHDIYKFNKDAQTCSCKDYIFSKCRNRMNACSRPPNLKHCAKGYGCFCPCPSNLFFKRDL